jgi:fermentation-respiration switch protein FrsA (DUF1100 family)
VKRRVRLTLAIALSVAALWVVLLFLVWRFQERVTFQPPRGIAGTREPRARQLHYRAPDGVPLFAYQVGEVDGARPLLLVFHGNADLARWQIPWAQEVVRRTGAAVVLAEYRGYDGLPGSPSYEGSRADARGALRFVLEELRVSPERLVYFGHSLGSAVAADLSRDHAPHTLLLQSPFTSAREMASRFPIPAVGWFWPLVARIRYDTRAIVKQLAVPVWVAHGDRDMVIPLRMGREVFEASRRKGELLVVSGAGHNDVEAVGGDDYWNWLARALHDDRSR